jgi:hypothetical protein
MSEDDEEDQFLIEEKEKINFGFDLDLIFNLRKKRKRFDVADSHVLR